MTSGEEDPHDTTKNWTPSHVWLIFEKFVQIWRFFLNLFCISCQTFFPFHIKKIIKHIWTINHILEEISVGDFLTIRLKHEIDDTLHNNRYEQGFPKVELSDGQCAAAFFLQGKSGTDQGPGGEKAKSDVCTTTGSMGDEVGRFYS